MVAPVIYLVLFCLLVFGFFGAYYTGLIILDDYKIVNGSGPAATPHPTVKPHSSVNPNPSTYYYQPSIFELLFPRQRYPAVYNDSYEIVNGGGTRYHP